MATRTKTAAAGEPVRVLYVSYLSAAAIMIILLVSAQTLIQYTLYREVQSRNVAGVINLQELRTQFLLRNSILLLVDQQSSSVHAQDLAQLTTTTTKWETTQDAIYTGNDQLNIHTTDFPQEGLVGVQKVRTNYNLMDATLHHMLYLETDPKANGRAIVRDVLTIFAQEIIVLPALNTLFDDMTLTADADVAQVRLIEIVLFALSLLTMTAEITFVIRPAHRRLKSQVNLLSAHFDKSEQEEAARKEQSVTPSSVEEAAAHPPTIEAESA